MSNYSKITQKILEDNFDALNREVALDWLKRHNYMSGAEWYERFEKDLNRHPHIHFGRIDALMTAKRASGLSQQNVSDREPSRVRKNAKGQE